MLKITDYPLPEAPTGRVSRMKDLFIQTKASMSAERAKIITKAYQKYDALPIVLKRAKAMQMILEELPIFIDDDEMIVGHPAAVRRGAEVFPERHMDWVEHAEEFETREFNSLKVSAETKSDLLAIYPYWKNKSVRHRMLATRPDFVSDSLACGLTINPHQWNGLGHLNPDYDVLLAEGLSGVRAKMQAAMEALRLEDPEYYNKQVFYQSEIVIIDALITFAHRYAALADELAATAAPARAAELRQIAENCRNVPEHPARTYYEALQSSWFVLLLAYIESNGFSISLGRMDQYMYPYLEKDLLAGTLDIDGAQELLDLFYLKTCEILRVDDTSFAWSSAGYSVGEHLIVGGVDCFGRDCTNLFSYLALKANEHIQLHQPNFAVRLHENTPEQFLNAVVKSISGGNGMPEVLNDEVVIPALLNKGIPLHLARDYAPIGCDEVTVRGQWGRCNGGYLNFAKVVEITMNEGKCMLTGKQIGLRTKPASEFTSFEDFMDAFNQQFDYAVKLVVNESNRTEWIHAELEPMPCLSMLTTGCLESGRDVTHGGARYNSTGPIGIGSANAGDSLMVIKKAVFETGRYTLPQLAELMRSNFEGHEIDRQYVRNKIPKFGNDIDEVDELVVRVTNRWFDQLERYKNIFGGPMWPALYSVSAQVGAGNSTAATADGRLATLPLSDGLTPMYGCDLSGPTAALKSVSKVDTMRAPNGVIINQRLTSSLFDTPDGFAKFKALLRSFVKMKSFHWQFNFVSSEVLRAAQANPEQYRSLVVRVAGYSAIFVDLCKKAQDSIIERTAAEL